MNKRIFFTAMISAVLIVLLVNNFIYYFLTKSTLENNLEMSMESEADQIRISFEKSRTSAEYLERSISTNLRTTSIAVQQQLDPNIENVTNEQLMELSKLFDVESISLLKNTGNDIVLYRSSEPKEIGISTRKWKPWYRAFNELFANHNVTIKWGESLPNFWAGPFEYSSAEPSSKSLKKYGYYYDGTTNYIIDPFVHDREYIEFQNNAGINAIINETIKSKRTNLLDVTAFNPTTFGTDEMVTKHDGGGSISHSTPRPIIFGLNKYSFASDVENVRNAATTGEVFSEKFTYGDEKLLRTYIPIKIKGSADITDKLGTPVNTYVLALTADYDVIENGLSSQFTTLVIEISIVSVLSIVLISFVVLFFLKRRDRDIQATQLAYIDDVNQMFTAIKGQRHDLLNHITTVHSMIKQKKYNEVGDYVRELVDDTQETNDIITIGQPAIAACIQSKVVRAIQRKIIFRHDFDNLTNFPLGLKSVDLVRIIGNLIDNAFDAVDIHEGDRRLVEVRGHVRNGTLHIVVSNPGELDGLDISTTIFEPGFTTKKNDKNSGLGLAITRQIVHKYGGSISVDTKTIGTVQFKVAISLN